MATQIQTPPMPTCVGGVILSKNSYKVLCLCFLRKRPDGKPVETPDEMLWREATHVARGRSQWGEMPERVPAAFRISPVNYKTPHEITRSLAPTASFPLRPGAWDSVEPAP
jgi:hypothetical protein